MFLYKIQVTWLHSMIDYIWLTNADSQSKYVYPLFI